MLKKKSSKIFSRNTATEMMLAEWLRNAVSLGWLWMCEWHDRDGFWYAVLILNGLGEIFLNEFVVVVVVMEKCYMETITFSNNIV